MVIAFYLKLNIIMIYIMKNYNYINLPTLLLSLFSVCNGHIFMQSPPSRRNLYSDYYVSNNLVNYNLRSPLNAPPDYFTFPCKGFPVGPSTYTFYDNQISLSLEGTATHGGGHCQFGVSYDNQNFVVLKTVLDTCLLDSMSYTFDLPNTAPDGKLIVFWSWINRIGNREYYMECADVNVIANNISQGQLSGKDLFIANLPGYRFIDEWSENDTPDVRGITQLLQTDNKTIYKNSISSSISSTTSLSSFSTSHSSSLTPSPTQPLSTLQPYPSSVCQHGKYTCCNDTTRVLQCVYGRFKVIDDCQKTSSKCVLISDVPYCV